MTPAAKARWQRYYEAHRDELLARRREANAAKRPAPHPRPSYSAADADVDEMAVQRLVEGDPPETYTSFERREAVRRLTLAGMGRAEVGRRLGIHPRQVHRDLVRFGLINPEHPRARRKVAS